MKEKGQQWKSMEELYKTPANRRLKYAAIAVIAVVIAIFAAMIFLHDDLSVKAYFFMRGCAGAGAIIFAILVGILVYRVNSAFIKQPRNSNHK